MEPEKTKNPKGCYFSTSPFPQVKVMDSPTKGRFVVAMKDFAPGDEIFTVETALSVPREGWGCIACCDRTCMGYCDTYRRYFMDLRPALNAIPAIAKETGTPAGHIRLVIKYLALRNSPKYSSVLSQIYDLKSARDKPIERDQDLLTAEKIQVHLTNVKESPAALSADIVHLLGVIPSNAHKVLHIQGAGLFPLASMLEHSCKPNAHYETQGPKLQVTAISAITQGQSITLNYLEPYSPRQERQEHLTTRYHFECKCELCLPEARDMTRAFLCQYPKCDGIVCPLGFGLEAGLWTCSKCSKGITNEMFHEMMELEKEIKSKSLSDVPVGELLEGGIFHQSHYLINRALDHRVRLLSRLRPAMCDNLLQRLIENADRVLTHYHPDKAVYYDMLGQVKKLMGDIQACREAFQEAYNIREKSCGKNSPSTLRAKQKFTNPEKVEISLWTPS